MHYKRNNNEVEFPPTLVSVEIEICTNEDTAKKRIKYLANMYFSDTKHDFYNIGGNDAYLGRSIIPRSTDTFYLGSMLM